MNKFHFLPLVLLLLVLLDPSTSQSSITSVEDTKAGNLKAPEIVNIMVQQVQVLPKNALWQQVEVIAQVTEVQKSASGLKAGQIIRLVYESPAPESEIPSGYTGPSIPQVGAHVKAYMYKGDTEETYRPREIE